MRLTLCSVASLASRSIGITGCMSYCCWSKTTADLSVGQALLWSSWWNLLGEESFTRSKQRVIHFNLKVCVVYPLSSLLSSKHGSVGHDQQWSAYDSLETMMNMMFSSIVNIRVASHVIQISLQCSVLFCCLADIACDFLNAREQCCFLDAVSSVRLVKWDSYIHIPLRPSCVCIMSL